jgi:bacteriorhodopsin
MGIVSGVSQLVLIAVATLAALLLLGSLVGRFFQNPKIRRRIMLAAVAVYLLALVAYFGFIAVLMSGNLNSN